MFIVRAISNILKSKAANATSSRHPDIFRRERRFILRYNYNKTAAVNNTVNILSCKQCNQLPNVNGITTKLVGTIAVVMLTRFNFNKCRKKNATKFKYHIIEMHVWRVLVSV